jgi:hypothetical protein
MTNLEQIKQSHVSFDDIIQSIRELITEYVNKKHESFDYSQKISDVVTASVVMSYAFFSMRMVYANGSSNQPVDESSINVNVLPLVAKLQAKSREITDLYLQTLKAIAEMPGEIQKIVDDFAKEKHADVDVVLADINKVGQVLQQDSVAKKARKAEIEEITRQYKKLQEESKELERKTQKVMSRLVEFEQKMAADGTLDLISPVHPVIKVLLD